MREGLVLIEYALTDGVSPPGQRFDLDRKTVQAWRNRWQAGGVDAEVPEDTRSPGLGVAAGVSSDCPYLFRGAEAVVARLSKPGTEVTDQTGHMGHGAATVHRPHLLA